MLASFLSLGIGSAIYRGTRQDIDILAKTMFYIDCGFKAEVAHV